MTVVDVRLYRASHKTFESYCRDRWQMSRRSANYMIASSTVVENISQLGHNCSQLPSSESVARHLAKLKPDW